MAGSSSWASYRPTSSNAPGQGNGYARSVNFANFAGDHDHQFGKGKGSKGSGKGRIHLPKVEWDDLQLERVNKNFLQVSPEVENRTYDECEKWQMINGIKISETGKFDDHPYDVPKPVTTWAESPFPDFIINALRGTSGFEDPFPIQSQVWPAALSGRDIVGIAETGSGKTLAYVLPMIVHVVFQKEVSVGEGPIALVFVPTRELSMQIKDHVERVTRYADQVRLKCVAIYGGPQNRDAQVEELRNGDPRPEIVIATPGRLIDMLNLPATNLRRATFLVVDEADELLTKGFAEQVELVLTQSRPDKQVLLFSATWPDNLEHLAEKLSTREMCSVDYPLLYVNQGSIKLSACKNINQRFWKTEETSVDGADLEHHPQELFRDKLNKLVTCIKMADPQRMIQENKRCLIFCNRKEDVEKVTHFLHCENIPVEGMLGGLTQEKRDEILQRFRQYKGTPILVCTDILGRGFDFPDVTYVVNFDMPKRVVNYIHRIGRSGRAGKAGFSMTFIDPDFFQNQRAWANTPGDLELVLRESGQPVPDWLLNGNEAVRRAKKRERRERWAELDHNRENQDPRGLNDNSDPTPATPHTESRTEEWHGRGSGKKYQELLARSVIGINQSANNGAEPQDVPQEKSEPEASWSWEVLRPDYPRPYELRPGYSHPRHNAVGR